MNERFNRVLAGRVHVLVNAEIYIVLAGRALRFRMVAKLNYVMRERMHRRELRRRNKVAARDFEEYIFVTKLHRTAE